MARESGGRVLPAVLLAVLVALPVGGYLVATGSPAPDDPPAPAVTERPVLVGTLALEPAVPAAGQPVTARAQLSADRPVRLRSLTVKVTDAAGGSLDFPVLRDLPLSTTPQEVTLHRALPAPGQYTYFLAYQMPDGTEVSLPPWQRVMVR
ncbi:hypothetical protein [Amycolatopsis suaedae]|uniref:Uncharacterized protein n=1 Tax=Amycolatopsis suaedae TaxID=2510978 RepID=A0A4Q7J3H4_9PSEU|nr:hypothetical protein [Amycolatopsis suaedae]RZQ61529.1 hypothetical protein EWH70_24530 [Amycolatopsis suaedae]